MGGGGNDAVDTASGIAANSTGPAIVAAGLRFPEGPFALEDGSIALVQIEAGNVVRIADDGSATVLAETGGGPNGAAFGPDGKLYVCNNGGFAWHRDAAGSRPVGRAADYVSGSIQRVDPGTGKCEQIFDRCDGELLSGPNDIVFDAFGGFYFTDLGKWDEKTIVRGAVYYVSPGCTGIRKIIAPISMPNGVGLSPDGTVLYVAETETARLWSFELAAPGRIMPAPFPSPNGGRLVFGAGGYERFDSLKLEECGNICVACIVSGTIAVISPGGKLVETVDLPGRYATNLCFSGKDRRTVHATLSMSGELVRLQWPRRGLAPLFARHR